MLTRAWSAIAGLVLAIPLSASSATNPPVYTGAMMISACYNQVNGQVRLVKPWEPAGCIPPAPYAGAADSSSAAICQTGGAFDCRANEYFVELNTQGPQGPAGPIGPQGPKGDLGPQGYDAAVSAPDPVTGCYAITIVDQLGLKVPGTAIATVCNGATGAKGDKGDPGAQGDPGAPGQGATVTAEPAGRNCPVGGGKITDGSGNVAYACNGASGIVGPPRATYPVRVHTAPPHTTAWVELGRFSSASLGMTMQVGGGAVGTTFQPAVVSRPAADKAVSALDPLAPLAVKIEFLDPGGEDVVSTWTTAVTSPQSYRLTVADDGSVLETLTFASEEVSWTRGVPAVPWAPKYAGPTVRVRSDTRDFGSYRSVGGLMYQVSAFTGGGGSTAVVRRGALTLRCVSACPDEMGDWALAVSRGSVRVEDLALVTVVNDASGATWSVTAVPTGLAISTDASGTSIEEVTLSLDVAGNH